MISTINTQGCYQSYKNLKLNSFLMCFHGCCSVAQSCSTLCNPMNCITPGFTVLHHLWGLLKLKSIELVMPSNNLILCGPLLFLPSIFPNIRVFSNELAFLDRWPKYWSFSFSPSSEYSGLISFRIDWFDFIAKSIADLLLKLRALKSN